LGQLGKTPFFKDKKPTPYDEAVNLIWYLKMYFTIPLGVFTIMCNKNIFEYREINNSIINIGFWPGGDRDGNPFVTPQITLNVAKKLKESIIKNYIKDVKYLRRRLTFKGIRERVITLNHRLHNTLLYKDDQIALDEFRKGVI
jgi:phosphoenolpyruvate carboxylase